MPILVYIAYVCVCLCDVCLYANRHSTAAIVYSIPTDFMFWICIFGTSISCSIACSLKTGTLLIVVCVHLFSVSQSESKHLLFGRPLMLQSSSDYCLLHHQGFISAYSKQQLMPLWSSFTVKEQVGLKTHCHRVLFHLHENK